MNMQRHISVLLLILMAMLCLPHKAVSQVLSVMPDSTHILLADSLHRLTAVDLQQLSESSDSANQQVLPHRANEVVENQLNVDSCRNEGSAVLCTTGARRDLGEFTPTRRQLRQQRLATFMPDPAKATWSALVFPGGGQIYNHKYWKLPIVYGGFLGCAYALNWNNQMYSDYSQAYLDIMDDDPGTASYEDFLPPRYNVEANKDYLKRVFKNRKDNYRRQRDLSIFCFIGVYLISVVDAYVDAELSNFDISDDLSVQVRPTTISNQQYTLPGQAYGLQCSFSF